MKIFLQYLLPGIIMLLASSTISAQHFYNQPSWRLIFKLNTDFSSPIKQIVNGPEEYYSAWYRVPAMGLRSEKQEITIAPVFVYLPHIYTSGSRGLLATYQYCITPSFKSNVFTIGGSAFAGNLLFKYYNQKEEEYYLLQNTFEFSIFTGLRHNLSEHLSFEIQAGAGIRSIKIAGYSRPVIGQLNAGISYCL